MKKTILSVLAIVVMTFAFGQSNHADSLAINYYLSPTKNFREDVMPEFAAYIKVNGKKYNLNTIVDINTKAGDIKPEIVYNKKARRNEYLLKTWFAGAGTNFKAYTTGSKEAKTASLLVYKQEVAEEVRLEDSKWKLVKAIKL